MPVAPSLPIFLPHGIHACVPRVCPKNEDLPVPFPRITGRPEYRHALGTRPSYAASWATAGPREAVVRFIY
jgi:hypothetical protein